MREATGDIWASEVAVVIPTNGVVIQHKSRPHLVMGAGLARQAARRYPELPFRTARWVKEYGNRVFFHKKDGLITFPTKHHWKEESSLSLIQQGVPQLLAIADKFELTEVALPRLGCGLGGLRWGDVRPLLTHLDDRFVLYHPL